MHLVTLDELVGVRIRAEVVVGLDAGVLDGAGPDDERGEYGPVHRISGQRALQVKLFRVVYHKFDYLDQELVEEGKAYPEKFVAGGALVERRAVAVWTIGHARDSGDGTRWRQRVGTVGPLVLVTHPEHTARFIALLAYLLYKAQRGATLE